MQAIGDISYFFPYYFNCCAKKSTNIQLGENIWYFSPCVFIFSPLGHAIIILLSQTEFWGRKIWQEGNKIIQCFIQLWETWKKMQAIGDIISYFFPYYFNCRPRKSTKIQLGENLWYFSPCLYFFPLRPCNNCSTFTDGVLRGGGGEIWQGGKKKKKF